MSWLLKVAAFKILSAIPAGETIYSLAQRMITRSVVPTKSKVFQKLEVGRQYVQSLEQILGNDYKEMIHIDVGAGWMPVVPLLFYSVGIDRQVLCDLRLNMDIRIVSDVARIFGAIVEENRQLYGKYIRRIPPLVEQDQDLQDYFSNLGIRYAAPFDLDDLLLWEGRKIVTCTQVLLYLDEDQVSSVFRMIARAISEGGIFIATIHLYDLWSDFDHSISRFNKWRYSDFVWNRLINSKLMSFNRLTPSIYEKLLTRNGLRIVEFKVTKPTTVELNELRNVRIHEKFHSIPETELAATELFFAAEFGG